MYIRRARGGEIAGKNIIHSAHVLSAVACLVCKSRILLSVESPATPRVREHGAHTTTTGRLAALREIPSRDRAARFYLAQQPRK